MSGEVLPGMEDWAVDRPGAVDMRDEKRYTTAVLARRYPKVFESIQTGLNYGIPVSAIAELLHVSKHTVMQVRDMLAAARPFFVEGRQRTLRGMIKLKSLELINERLNKGEDLTLEELKRLANWDADGGTDNPSVKPTNKKTGDTIEIEDVMAWNEAIDGLMAEENSAREVAEKVEGDGVEADGESGLEGSTGSKIDGCCSVEQSAENEKRPTNTRGFGDVG